MVLEAVKHVLAGKAKESITFKKLGSLDFWCIGKSAIPPLFRSPELLSSASDKAKLFAKSLSKNSNLGNLDMSFTFFPF